MIDQDEGDYIDVPADLGTLAADSSAVVIATFMGASGEASEVEPDVPRLKTFNRFRLVETLKVDPRLPEVGSTLDVLDGGGGSITRSKPFRAVKLSPDSQLLVPGHSYVLYLHWHAPESRFYLTFGRYSVFDVTGPVALPVDPSSPLASAVAGLGPGEGLVALRASAMSSQKPQPAFDTP